MKKLSYGENHRQANAWLEYNDNYELNDPLALRKIEQVAGSSLSYINLTDVDRLIHTANRLAAACQLNFSEVPGIAIAVKHGNACGAAIGNIPALITQNMVAGDPTSISGGAVLLTTRIDSEIAQILQGHLTSKRILDLIIAPDFSNDAIELLSRKNGKCRMLKLDALANKFGELSQLDVSLRYRQVRGAKLFQDGDPYVLSFPESWHQESDNQTLRDIVLGWAIGSTANSNSIILTKNGMLIGGGTGQRSRVVAAKLALLYAHDGAHDTNGAIAYSDSFFPFVDGPEVLAKAGVRTVFASSGSIRDKSISERLEQLNVEFLRLPDTEIRGFFAH